MSFSPRSRVAALAVGLSLSLSLAGAPVVVAQDDDPTSAVQALADTLEAGQYTAVEDLFCDAFKSEAAALSFSEMAAGLPPDVDPEVIVGAIQVRPTIETLETVEQSDLEATVRLVGTLALDIDVEALEPLIVALLEAGGQEVTEDMVDMIGGMMATQFTAESFDIDEEITVARADAESPWLLCDTLGSGEGMDDPEGSPDSSSTDAEAMTDPDASADPEAVDDAAGE